MNTKDDILIEKYLKNQLSDDAIILFNKRIDTDAVFKEKFAFEKELFQSLNENEWSICNSVNLTKEYKQAFESKEIVSLKKKLVIENKKYQNFKRIKKTNFKVYIVAATILILISIVFFNSQENFQNKYTRYLDQTELSSFVTRGKNKAELIQAQTYFENKEYTKALKIFKTILKNSKNRTGNLYLYTGISQMQLNKNTEAITTFESLINSDLLDAEKGYWFKALILLKEDKIAESKVVLNKIISEKLYNHQKATTLLAEL